MSLFSTIANRRLKKPPACTAVIAAAGVSRRCRGEDKLYHHITGKPVLAHAIGAFQRCALVDEIIIVAREERFGCVEDICTKYGFDKVAKIMKGGKTRPESVYNGVYAASDKARLVAVHDGARPCIDIDTIERTIYAATKHHAAAPAVPVASTVKKVEGMIISETVDREGLYEIQTPQIFKIEVIKAALTHAVNKSVSITDDCMAVEMIGVPVHITEGSRGNIKITDCEDLRIAEALLGIKGKYPEDIVCG
jgi:2-C-methyl-D-erythritol 4-phosphate cytidylyltransferase